ncbi:MAG: acetylxylan esterase [Planctomycetales bacterium]|nr:acetylxylan esterase [Planctomycetales bacterium]
MRGHLQIGQQNQGIRWYWPAIVWTSLVCVPFFVRSRAAAQDTSHGRNYDESKVIEYQLPDPLLSKDGHSIVDPHSWRDRRDETMDDFRDLMYGHTPELPWHMRATVNAERTDAVGGLATRTLINLQFFDDPQSPSIDLMLYVPNGISHPVGVLLGLNFNGNASVEADPAIPITQKWMRPKPGVVVDNVATEAIRGANASRWPIAIALSQGFAVATLYYGDIEPDHIAGWRDGIRGYVAALEGRTELRDNEWGAIGAWAWGLSRAVDYLETLPQIDSQRIAVFGHSRLGKTALWAGAQDERFAVVISNNSGEGGASLARRNFGENIAYSIAHASWRYCKRFHNYIDRETELPFDQHMLIAMMAPRPVYIASATNDLLADPKGEFLSAVHAEPVYRLWGYAGLGTANWPTPDHSIGDRIGYHLRTGEHDITDFDWQQYVSFCVRHLNGAESK